MRYLILSDIHANWEALEAVWNDSAGGYDRVVNCGDLVGYGPDPNRVTEFCRQHCDLIVRGNHDKAIAGLSDIEWFNPSARSAVLWAQAALSVENLEFLRSLPAGPLEVDGFSVIHGSPADEDEYLIQPGEAFEAVSFAATGLSFFGHTHLQGGFWILRRNVQRIQSPRLELEETTTYLVNPGSVGQPRDGDPRAAYALYDSEERSIEFRRVEYDLWTTHAKIAAAGLPEHLGLRLHTGQ